MTAHSLARIVSEELAAIGIVKFKGDNRLGRPRRTVWSLTLPGFGIRHHGSGRQVYVLQTIMAGKQRLVTLGNASILTKAEAIDVAKGEKIRFPDDFVRKCLRYLKKAGNHFPSLAVDLINNRETEIDYFNGKIVEYGRKHYIRTSLNLAFTNMVKAMTIKNGIGIKGKNKHRNNLTGSNVSGLFRPGDNCFLGVDLGSSYVKIVVTNDKNELLFHI